MFKCDDCDKRGLEQVVTTWDRYLTMCLDCADDRVAAIDASPGDFDWGAFEPPDEARFDAARQRLGIDAAADDEPELLPPAKSESLI